MFGKSIVIAVVLSAPCNIAVAQENTQFTLPHISITGSSFAGVRPDIATLRLGVISEKPTAAEAESENSNSSTSVIAELKDIGVDPKDIQTSSLTLAPVMVEERDPKTNGITKRTLTGYRASNYLDVTIRDVDKAGSMASRVVAMGANTYQGLTFEVSDAATIEDDQRAKAIAEAIRRAKLYAHSASMRLGRLLAIDPEADRNDGGMADLPTRKVDNSPHVVVIPVEPGLVQIGGRVSVTWELLPE